MSSCDSSKLLHDYAYYIEKIDKHTVPKTNLKIRDMINCGECKEDFCDFNLYSHQIQVINKLEQGKNVILTASTGSGKTEAWFLYVIRKIQGGNSNYRALVLYPTKALTNNQADRLYRYMNCLGLEVNRVGQIYSGKLVRYDGDTSRKKAVSSSLHKANIILTNPQMLFFNIRTIPKPNLIVIDELDFYDSGSATALVELLRERYPNSQFAIIGGTLSNPQDFPKDFEFITGDSNRPEHRYYIVIGKENEVRDLYQKYESKLSQPPYYVSNYEDFKKRIYEIYYQSILNNDLDLKNGIYDIITHQESFIEDILKLYKQCKGEITIGFFSSIDYCERYSRVLGVPAHHSKIRKSMREKIEDELRNGNLNMVFTVKTLMQGIDIGQVKRIIHVNIPLLVRDFLQREGRKGRRENIDFTESIIIPLFFDARIKNFNTLKAWISIKPESLIYNPDNLYVKLVKAIMKVKEEPDLSKLSKLEQDLLSIAGFIKDNQLNLRRINNFAFYNFESPRNTVIYIDNEKPIEIDKVSLKEMIEYYQIGSIDIANKGIVTEIRRTPLNELRKTQYHYQIIEKPYSEAINDTECIREGVDNYRIIVEKWRDKEPSLYPDFELDVELGKIRSKVKVNVYFTGEGFVKYNELPEKVIWYIESRKRIPIKKNEKIKEHVYLSDVVELKCKTYPTTKGYTGFTYAYAYEIAPLDGIDIGMIFLLTALRLKYGVRLDLITFNITGNLLKVWETSPTGLLEKMREGNLILNNEKLDFQTFSEYLRNVKVDEKFETLFYTLYPVRGVDFEKARKVALYLAEKLFKIARIRSKVVQTSLDNNVIVYDSLLIGDKQYTALTYYYLGREEVVLVSDSFRDASSKLLEIISSKIDDVEDIKILTTSPIPDKVLKLINVKLRDLRKEYKEKEGIDISPSDFSDEITKKELELDNLLHERKISENEYIHKVKELFKLRAEIIQGIARYLDEKK
ncbi:DEAD/DEAH box helicase [Sulfolobus sp. E11-6]|uniref:DEAD/DEAH box helicase n=1 Tax=Sulfolobus sp. E11-6 TaxID=2663020 RepID=UPI00129802A9|nr:DEAD/DEAH box helicase [Sulfolobus sp. E11-6]QGA68939.1 DEAD/DEAH box helicase [Sulfolobus sp. E11-6]